MHWHEETGGYPKVPRNRLRREIRRKALGRSLEIALGMFTKSDSDDDDVLSAHHVPSHLAHPKCGLPALLARREAAQQTDSIVRRLQLMLRTETLSLGVAARKLGVSVRTLQRRLAEVGTSFRSESQSVRLQTAQSMLSAGGVSVTRVALELGFGSLQHFSAQYRKHYGLSPSAWLKQLERDIGANR